MATTWQVVTPTLPVWTATDLSATVVSMLQKGAIVYGCQKGNWVALDGKPWCCMINGSDQVCLEEVQEWEKQESFSRSASPLSTTPGSSVGDMTTEDDDVRSGSSSESLCEEHNSEPVSSNPIAESMEAPVETIIKWQVVTPNLALWTARDRSAKVVSKLEEGRIFYGRQTGNWVTLHGKPWWCKISDGHRVFLKKVEQLTSEEEMSISETVGHALNPIWSRIWRYGSIWTRR